MENWPQVPIRDWPPQRGDLSRGYKSWFDSQKVTLSLLCVDQLLPCMTSSLGCMALFNSHFSTQAKASSSKATSRKSKPTTAPQQAVDPMEVSIAAFCLLTYFTCRLPERLRFLLSPDDFLIINMSMAPTIFWICRSRTPALQQIAQPGTWVAMRATRRPRPRVISCPPLHLLLLLMLS